MKKIKILKIWDLPEEYEIDPWNAKMDYIQEYDCCDENQLDQLLTIETHNWGIEAKDTFYVMSTQRWAFDKPEDVILVLQDFIKRFQ